MQTLIFIILIIIIAIICRLFRTLNNIASDINEIKYNKSTFAVTVSLDLKTIFKRPHFANSENLLQTFKKLYFDSKLEEGWYKCEFIVKDSHIFVNGKISSFVSDGLSLPNVIKPTHPYNINTYLHDSDIVIYYDVNSFKREFIARFPLAFFAYRYNYHPNYLLQVYHSESNPEFGTREKDFRLKHEYDQLRKLIVDGKSDTNKCVELATKFDSLLEEYIRSKGIQVKKIHLGTEFYDEKNGFAITISPVEHGL